MSNVLSDLRPQTSDIRHLHAVVVISSKFTEESYFHLVEVFHYIIEKRFAW